MVAWHVCFNEQVVAIVGLHCHAIKKIIRKPFSVLEVKKLLHYRRINKTLLQVLGLYVSPNFKYLSKYFAQIYWAQYGAAMLVYLQGTPTWRPENSVNIRNWK